MVRRSRKLTDNGHHSNVTEQNISHIGGNLHPLTESDLSVITSHAYDILSKVGMSSLLKMATDRALKDGAWHRQDG